MARLIWEKAAAKSALDAIATDVAKFFAVPAPITRPNPYRAGADWELGFDTIEVWTKAGAAEMNVTVSGRFAHLYFRFGDPARARELIGGHCTRLNPCSGKYNAIAAPADYALGGAPDPAASLDVFRAGLRRDFRRYAEPNPPADEVAAHEAAKAESAAQWARARK